MVKHTNKKNALKCTFSEINLAKPCQNALVGIINESNQVDSNFKHCFRLSVLENSVQYVFACVSENDRENWVRCLNLIIQMKEMNIDHSKVNIFTFEKFYTQ